MVVWWSRRAASRRAAVRAAALAAAHPPPEVPLPPVEEAPSKSSVGAAPWPVVVLAVLTVALVVVTLLGGTPIVSGVWSVWFFTAGVVLSVVSGVLWGRKWVQLSPGWVRNISALFVGFGCIAAVAGAVSTPVVANGRVLASTSATAAQTRFVQQMRDDIYVLRDADVWLASPDAAAWADKRTLEKNAAAAGDIAAKYQKVLDGQGPPSPELADPSRRTMTAAYLLVRAYETKEKTLIDDSAPLNEELLDVRTKFAKELEMAAASLVEASNSLGLPVDLAGGGAR